MSTETPKYKLTPCMAGYNVTLPPDETVIAFVYQRETSKTGFKNGRCVGQVTCDAWFYTVPGSTTEYGRSRRGMGEPRWFSRKALLRDLGRDLQELAQGERGRV